MQHPMYRVASFSIVGPHELEVAFDDGLVRRINFLPVLEGALFGPLEDLFLRGHHFSTGMSIGLVRKPAALSG